MAGLFFLPLTTILHNRNVGDDDVNLQHIWLIKCANANSIYRMPFTNSMATEAQHGSAMYDIELVVFSSKYNYGAEKGSLCVLHGMCVARAPYCVVYMYM